MLGEILARVAAGRIGRRIAEPAIENGTVAPARTSGSASVAAGA
jgi:hypothetical protein